MREKSPDLGHAASMVSELSTVSYERTKNEDVWFEVLLVLVVVSSFNENSLLEGDDAWEKRIIAPRTAK